jgi:sulfite dehydrogenase (quinone) subunit SoeA
MQALTGLFARQFGTPNYAAHGGFCSVNMAAGMIYTIGGSFWEFGGPDLERAKLFVMIGTAEDHHSNPMKIALSQFKRDGGRFISINPVRTGYSAIADEWIPIRPGTDGALFMALMQVLIEKDLIDRPFLQRFTNAPQLVVLDEGEREGLFAFDPERGQGARRATAATRTTSWCGTPRQRPCAAGLPRGHRRRLRPGAGRPLRAARRHARGAQLPAAARPRRDLHARVGREDHRHPGRAHPQAGRGAGPCRLPAGLRDAHPLDRRLGQGTSHDYRPPGGLPRHARPGGAFSNGFQTVRALAVMMSLLGTIDAPRRLPPQGALPAAHRAQLPGLQRPGDDPAQHAAERGAAGLPGAPRRNWRSMPRARRSASTTRSPGSIRCRRTG